MPVRIFWTARRVGKDAAERGADPELLQAKYALTFVFRAEARDRRGQESHAQERDQCRHGSELRENWLGVE